MITFALAGFSISRNWPFFAALLLLDHSGLKLFLKSMFFKKSTKFWKNHHVFLIGSTVYLEKLMIWKRKLYSNSLPCTLHSSKPHLKISNFASEFYKYFTYFHIFYNYCTILINDQMWDLTPKIILSNVWPCSLHSSHATFEDKQFHARILHAFPMLPCFYRLL